MKKFTYNRVFCKTLAVFLAVIIVSFSANLLIFAGWGGAGGSGNVFIQILGGGAYGLGGYRYSCDVIYYSMEFTFNVRSFETNTETGETYIATGDWLMSENMADAVDVTVINHSDTPIRVTARVNKNDFEESGVEIERVGLQGVIIPACRLDEDGVIISESEMTLSLVTYPDVDYYKGKKQFFVTVCIVPASGYATNGNYYESNFDSDF